MSESISINGQALPWRPGMTVADAVAARGGEHDLLTVLLDGELVDQDQWATTALAAGAALRVVELHHGG